MESIVLASDNNTVNRKAPFYKVVAAPDVHRSCRDNRLYLLHDDGCPWLKCCVTIMDMSHNPGCAFRRDARGAENKISRAVENNIQKIFICPHRMDDEQFRVCAGSHAMLSKAGSPYVDK